MRLVTAATIVSVGIALSCLLPHYSNWVRARAKVLLLVGTIVLLGFVVFDLVPEMLKVGGLTSLVLIAASWAVFSVIHSRNTHTHETHHEALHHELEPKKHHSMSFLLGSMALHCFAGGMLLVSSYSVSERLAFGVFLSLVAHKAFEAVSFSSLLIERTASRRHLYFCVSIYALSFPLGVLLTAGVDALMASEASTVAVKKIAMILTSVAVGSLFGCLLQDFLLPVIRELRRTSWKFGRA